MDLIDISGIPDKSGDCVQRGITIANAMCKMLGLNLMQACAIVGYCMKESSCNPASYNKSEAAGNGTGYANGANCGEGIAQWTNVAYKDKNLAVIGIGPGGHPGKITSLSLDQQIQMLAKGSLGQAYLRYKLNTATSWDAAIACACIQGHGSGHAQNCFTDAGGNINSEVYVRAVMSKYGGREDLRRAKKWGQQVFAAMGGRPGDYSGGMAGGNHEWPDFNYRSYPILEDDKGKYTNEPILMGIVNHLRIEGSPGTDESLMEMNGEGFNVAGTALASDIIMDKKNSSNIMKNVPNRSIRYLAIHYTAGASSKPGAARNMPDSWEKRAREHPNNKGSADFGVDDGGMYQFNPDPRNWVTFAVGGNYNGNGGKAYKGRANNTNSISIEVCSTMRPGGNVNNANDKNWYFTDAALANAIKLARFLMKQFNIPRENVIRHYDVSGKLCPGIIGWNDGPIPGGGMSNSSQWQKFKNSL